MESGFDSSGTFYLINKKEDVPIVFNDLLIKSDESSDKSIRILGNNRNSGIRIRSGSTGIYIGTSGRIILETDSVSTDSISLITKGGIKIESGTTTIINTDEFLLKTNNDTHIISKAIIELISNYNNNEEWYYAIKKLQNDNLLYEKLRNEAINWIHENYFGPTNTKKLINCFNEGIN